MGSRFPGRVLIALGAVAAVLTQPFGRRKPMAPRRILVLHHLLLGDTLMLTPLLKKLRQRFPEASITMTCPAAFAGLYATRPFGVEALPFDERNVATIRALFHRSRFDLAIIPAENRLSLLARAIRSRWIVGFAGDRPGYKSWFMDELHPFPSEPAAWGDFACILVDGPAPEPYSRADWPAPAAALDLPEAPYCVLHVGASTPLKFWEPEKWRGLANALEARGLRVVLSAGPREASVLDGIDPDRRWTRFAGNLSLPQLWKLLHGARLLVCPDTGVAHLARVADVPVVTIYGGGSSLLFGGGEFWRAARERKVTLPAFPCRDENIVFRRPVPWAGNCARTPDKCPAPKCMHGIPLAMVHDAVISLLRETDGDSTVVPIAGDAR